MPLPPHVAHSQTTFRSSFT